jgi:hypothetical protein
MPASIHRSNAPNRSSLRSPVTARRSVTQHTGYTLEVLIDRLDLSPEEFATATGWTIKPEGACKAEVCVPLGRERFDLMAVSERLGMVIVPDEQSGLWAIGPESLTNRVLVSADAPELVLPDLDGREFRLSSLRGQKVVIVSWAPY